MHKFAFLFVFITLGLLCHANEIDYKTCQSIQDVIARETQEITDTDITDHDEIAQLYVSRGETYLLNGQYEMAVRDFKQANYHVGYASNNKAAMVVAFRAAFGEAVGYDNLGMEENTQEALHQLQVIASHVGCDDCKDHIPCPETIHPAKNMSALGNMLILCKNKKSKPQSDQDNYDDILGPDEPLDSSWYEEVVTGVGRAMDAIACLAPSYPVKIALIAVIEALIVRGIKCCQAGGFWKACVAPITRKWKEWKDNKENQILPNSNNLKIYIDGIA